ncbi:MAG: hypothetical protein IT353_24810 [Gemmatimonadaceae bacterium]|nr:hypothetical protein [Gemmatimonadaceae bacterium]
MTPARSQRRFGSWRCFASTVLLCIAAVATARTLRAQAIATTGHAAAATPSSASFVVIVHPANPTTELKRAAIKDFFLKRRVDWTPTLAAEPIDLAPKLTARSLFSRDVLALSTTAVTNYWMQEIFEGGKTPPPVMSTAAAAVAFVAATPGAIAYVPADTPLDRVRVLKVIP